VYYGFDPSSGAEAEIYRVTGEGLLVIKKLKFTSQDTTVSSCLPQPNWFIPLNLPGVTDITEKIGMTPVSITVDSALHFTMNFNSSINLSPFSANTTKFGNVEMTVRVEWTNGDHKDVSWFVRIHSDEINTQAYSLTDQYVPNIQTELNSYLTLSSVTNFRIQCAGLVPVY
jgi:hypothetical protein